MKTGSEELKEQKKIYLLQKKERTEHKKLWTGRDMNPVWCVD